MKRILAILALACCILSSYADMSFGTEILQGRTNDVWGILGEHVRRWSDEGPFDEYIEIGGKKYPVVSSEGLGGDSTDAPYKWFMKAVYDVVPCDGQQKLWIPVVSDSTLKKGDITPIAVGGTLPHSLVDLTVMTDAELYSELISQEALEPYWRGKFFSENGQKANRLWIQVGVHQGEIPSVPVEVDVSTRPAAGKWSNMTMTEYAAQYGVDFRGTLQVYPCPWFCVGIKESGDVFPTPIYKHALDRAWVKDSYVATKALADAWVAAMEAIDDCAENESSEAILCMTPWSISAKEAGAMELVVLPSDIRGGVVSGNGVYIDGTKVKLTATPNKGYMFAGWSDGVTTASRTVTVSGDAEYVAIFRTAGGSEDIEYTYRYDKALDGVVLTGYSGVVPADLTLPSEIDGKTVVGISHGFMEGCETLQSLTLPSTIRFIEDKAFSECVNLATLHLNEGLETIGQKVFRENTSLTSVVLPSTLRAVGEESFTRSNEDVIKAGRRAGIASIFVRGGDNSWIAASGGVLYDKVNRTVIMAVTGTSEITVPDGCEKIAEDAFLACHALQSVTFPASLKRVANEAFAGCISLTELDFGGTALVAVGGGAFCGCQSLTTAHFPASLTAIGASIFGGDNNLMSVTFDGNAPTITLDDDDEPEMEGVPYASSDYVIGPDGDWHYTGLIENVVTYVNKGTTGWGDVPGTWQGLPIEYLPEKAKFTVSFNANGGKCGEASREVVDGNAVGKLPVPTRVGYVFAGWWTKPAGGAKVFASTIVAGDVPYYAQWTAKTYTLTLDPNGGTYKNKTTVHTIPNASQTAKLTYGIGNYWRVGVATRTGYTFKGWYTATTGGKQVYNANGEAVKGNYWSASGSTATWKYDGNVTLYAQWTAKTYTLTLNPNGGSYNGKTTVHAIPNATQTTKPTYGKGYYWRVGAATRTGYTFKGWYTAATGGTQVYDANGEAVDGDYWKGSGKTATWAYDDNVTLYAQWAKAYTVRFYPNGSGSTLSGSIFGASDGQPKTATVTFGLKSDINNVVGVAKRSGYVFLGWYTQRDAGGLVFDANGNCRKGGAFWNSKGCWIKESNVSLYAHWAKAYTVRFYPNGIGSTLSGSIFGASDGQSKTATVTFGLKSDINNVVGVAKRPGYVFAGWYTQRDAGGLVFDANGKCRKGGAFWNSSGCWIKESNVSLYAHWTKVSASAPPVIGSSALAVTAPNVVASETVDGVAYLPDGESFPVEARIDADGFAVVELEDAIFCGYIADGSGELVCADGMHLVVFLAEP